MDSQPEWRAQVELALSKASNANTATYLQLASHSPEHGPQVRTLVFRGFGDTASNLLMATDRRSSKVSEFEQDSRAQIAWYFLDTREQFRLSGHIRCITDNGSNASRGTANRQVDFERDQLARAKLWRSMSLRARQAFYATAMGETSEESAKLAESSEPAPNFVMLSLEVLQVEHLDIANNPHRRTRFKRHDNGWVSERIAL